MSSFNNFQLFFRSVPLDEPIDLINVAFEQKPRSSNAQTKSGKKRKEKQSAKAAANIETTNFSVPDRLTGTAGLEELRRINPARQWNLIEVSLRVMMRLKPSLLGRWVDTRFFVDDFFFR